MERIIWHPCPECGHTHSKVLSRQDLYDDEGAFIGIATLYRCLNGNCRSRHDVHEMIPEIAAYHGDWCHLHGA